MSHTCHAYGCGVPTEPEMFMCLRHWRMLPRLFQRGIWASYRKGQCDDWKISKLYAERAKESVRYVAFREGKVIPDGDASLRLYDELAE